MHMSVCLKHIEDSLLFQGKSNFNHSDVVQGYVAWTKTCMLPLQVYKHIPLKHILRYKNAHFRIYVL